MERYKGKSRFIVVKVLGEPGYTVSRLDGLLRDYNVTPVYKGIRTRRSAEQLVRRLARHGVLATNTKLLIPIETKQEAMRRRHGLASASANTAGARTRPYTIDELVELHGRSRRTVIRLYENEPGIENVVTPETMHSRQHRSIRVPHYIYERVRHQLGGV